MKELIINIFAAYRRICDNLLKDAKAAIILALKCWIPLLAIAFLIWAKGAYGCGRWVLEGSMNNTGSKYSSGTFNLCYYQDLNGSGQTLKMRLPTDKECPVILDPCPEGGSDTTVIVNQKPASDNKFDRLMDEYLKLKNQ